MTSVKVPECCMEEKFELTLIISKIFQMAVIWVNKCVYRNEDRISIPLGILTLKNWFLAKVARKVHIFH